jgi:starvation-inducible DNA-binding protein
MKYLNLDRNKVATTAQELNNLLADYHLYYQKLRNFHWNIVGQSFFDLHVKFEEMYNDALLKIDEIAERILTLRCQPISNYSDYLSVSNIAESSSNLDAQTMVETLLEDHGIILQQLKKVSKAANDANDEGTNDIVGGYIRDLEKVSWMLDAYISQPLSDKAKTNKTSKKAGKKK